MKRAFRLVCALGGLIACEGRELTVFDVRPGAPVGAFLAGIAVAQRLGDGPQALEDIRRALEPTFKNEDRA